MIYTHFATAGLAAALMQSAAAPNPPADLQQRHKPTLCEGVPSTRLSDAEREHLLATSPASPLLSADAVRRQIAVTPSHPCHTIAGAA